MNCFSCRSFNAIKSKTRCAYQPSKRGNSLRVMAEAVHWGKRGARINTISPGIIMTPAGEGRTHETAWRRVPPHDRRIGGQARGYAGRGRCRRRAAHARGWGFITGSDFLMDGGVTAAYWYGDVAEVRGQ